MNKTRRVQITLCVMIQFDIRKTNPRKTVSAAEAAEAVCDGASSAAEAAEAVWHGASAEAAEAAWRPDGAQEQV